MICCHLYVCKYSLTDLQEGGGRGVDCHAEHIDMNWEGAGVGWGGHTSAHISVKLVSHRCV